MISQMTICFLHFLLFSFTIFLIIDHHQSVSYNKRMQYTWSYRWYWHENNSYFTHQFSFLIVAAKKFIIISITKIWTRYIYIYIYIYIPFFFFFPYYNEYSSAIYQTILLPLVCLEKTSLEFFYLGSTF